MRRTVFPISIFIISFLLMLSLGCKGKSSDTEKASMDLFTQAQEFQKNDKFEDAVRIYRQISRDYPKTKQGANSQFMVGYIYANHIKDYNQARIELSRFIDNFGKFADSGLVAGAKFELEYLGKDINDIPILSGIGQGEIVTDTTTTE